MVRFRLLVTCGMSVLCMALFSACVEKPFYSCVDMAGARRYSETPCQAREASEDLPQVLRRPPNVHSESGMVEAIDSIIRGNVLLELPVLNRVFAIVPSKEGETDRDVWYKAKDGGIDYLYSESNAFGNSPAIVLSMRIDRKALCVEPAHVTERFGAGLDLGVPQHSAGKFSIIEYSFPSGGLRSRARAQIRVTYELQPKACATEIWMMQTRPT